MDCTEARSRLQAYVDRELDLQDTLALERHLASCARCQAIFAREAALQSALRRHVDYHAAPTGLAQRIRARLAREMSFASPRTRFAWRLPSARKWLQLGAAAAAGAVISWTAAIQYAGVSADERMAKQVINGYARSMVTAHLVDVASSDRHTVKPWLSSKLDFSPTVVDLAGEGFPLLGGRLDYVDHRPVAALVYRHRQHVIDLFVWPESGGAAAAPPKALSRRGYNVLYWKDGAMVLWAISDVEPAELKAFADAYARAK